MNCASCGTPIAPGVRFCVNCGRPASPPRRGLGWSIRVLLMVVSGALSFFYLYQSTYNWHFNHVAKEKEGFNHDNSDEYPIVNPESDRAVAATLMHAATSTCAPFIIMLLVSLVLSLLKRLIFRPRPIAAAMLVLIVGSHLAGAGAALADNGGWSEGGGRYDKWIKSPRAQDVIKGSTAAGVAAGAGGLIGATAGTLVGSAAGGVGGKTEPEPPKEEPPADRANPCEGELARFEMQQIKSEALLAALTQTNSLLQTLEEIYQQTWKTGYTSGVVDVAFLAGSLIGRVTKGTLGFLGREYLGASLKQKLLDAALKSLLKSQIKDYDLMKTLLKQPEDVGKKFLQEKLTESIVSRIMQDRLANGLRVGGFDGATVKLLERMKNYDGVKDIVKNAYAKPVADLFGDMLSLYNAGMDAATYATQLEMIRQRLSNARQQAFALDQQLEEEIFQTSLARDSFNACTQGEAYQRYLRRLAFDKLPSQG